MDFLQIFFVLCFTIVVEPLFQGFSIKREFDVSFKPFIWKPISFIKEKFSPFGRFGVRHGIQKRHLLSVEPAPVFEPTLHIEPAQIVGPFLKTSTAEREMPIVSSGPKVKSTSILTPVPASTLLPLTTSLASRPITSFRPGSEFLLPPVVPEESQPPTVVITPVPIFRPVPYLSPVTSSLPSQILNQNEPQLEAVQPISLGNPLHLFIPFQETGAIISPNSDQVIPEQILPQISTPLPNFTQSARLSGFLPSNSPSMSPLFTTEVIGPIRPTGGSAQSSGILNTDIGRSELVNNYLNAVERQPGPIKAEEDDTPPLPNNGLAEGQSNGLFGNSTLMRGTRLALHFSNVFVQLLSQFLSNARITLNQLPELKPRE